MAQTALIAVAWFAGCMATTWFLVRLLIPRLAAWGRVDRPNERSSHSAPVLRGGGLAVVLVLIPAVAINAWLLADRTLSAPLLLLAGFCGLATISWRDDRKSLPVAVRLAAQIAAVALGFAAMPQLVLVFQGYLPPAADHLVAGLAWVWFINLYNFMDGIDGISGAETASIGVGLVLVVMAAGLAMPIAGLGAAFAGAACGFLLWNWTPARLFLGDVGSIPLGFIAGFALLCLAANGHLVAAVILPLYYLFDATLTLLRRLARGEPVWRAHRSHAYQIAASATSHPAVVRRIIVLNAVLILLALGVAIFAGNAVVAGGGLALALAATGALVAHFRAMGAAGLKSSNS